MAIEQFRRITIEAGGANAKHAPVYLSAGDDAGRILRFVVRNGTQAVSGDGLSCRFLIDEGAGLYQDMTLVAGEPTATWEAALHMGGVTPGNHRAAFRVTDSDGGIVCTREFMCVVEAGVLADGEQSEEMQDALSDFEERVRAAEETADGLANVRVAFSATQDGRLEATDVDGAVTGYDVAGQVATYLAMVSASISSAGLLRVYAPASGASTYDVKGLTEDLVDEYMGAIPASAVTAMVQDEWGA